MIYLLKRTITSMVSRKISDEEIQEQKEHQKVRITASRAARRSGKISKQEGKVSKSNAKTRTPRSQKRTATVKKSRY